MKHTCVSQYIQNVFNIQTAYVSRTSLTQREMGERFNGIPPYLLVRALTVLEA